MECVDVRGHKGKPAQFFRVFGANPLFLYLLSEGILWPLMLVKVNVQSSIPDGRYSISIWEWAFNGIFVPLFGEQGADLAFAILNVLVCWLVGYILYRRKIFIRL